MKLVKWDNAKHPEFAELYLAEEKKAYQALSGMKVAVNLRTSPRPPTRAQHELWEADEHSDTSHGKSSMEDEEEVVTGTN